MNRLFLYLLSMVLLLFFTECEKHDDVTYNISYLNRMGIQTYFDIEDDNIILKDLYNTILSEVVNYQQARYNNINKDLIQANPELSVDILIGENRSDWIIKKRNLVSTLEEQDIKERGVATSNEEDIIQIAEKYKERLNNKDLYGKGSFVIRCTMGAWRFHYAEHDYTPDYSKDLVKTHIVIWLKYGEDKLSTLTL